MKKNGLVSVYTVALYKSHKSSCIRFTHTERIESGVYERLTVGGRCE